MGVYIKGIEMPKGSDEHRLIIRENGQVIIDKKTYWEEAEAVPVPKHGRLIDADKFITLVFADPYQDFVHIIEKMPTIIPASEEGE